MGTITEVNLKKFVVNGRFQSPSRSSVLKPIPSPKFKDHYPPLKLTDPSPKKRWAFQVWNLQTLNSATPQFSGANLAGSGFRGVTLRLREKNILQSLPHQQEITKSIHQSSTTSELGRICLSPWSKTPALFLAPGAGSVP